MSRWVQVTERVKVGYDVETTEFEDGTSRTKKTPRYESRSKEVPVYVAPNKSNEKNKTKICETVAARRFLCTCGFSGPGMKWNLFHVWVA